MSRFIGKIEDKYFEYSTVVDAPVSVLMSLEDFKNYYKEEYGEQAMPGLKKRLDRADEKGTSSLIDDSFESMISCNYFGDGKQELTAPEFIKLLKAKSESATSYYL